MFRIADNNNTKNQYGEFDCWKLECPPLTCDKPLPLAPGDCCPRCEDDPCNILVGSNSTGIYAAGKPCTYKGHEYESGQQFSDLSSHCTTCACKVISSKTTIPNIYDVCKHTCEYFFSNLMCTISTNF